MGNVRTLALLELRSGFGSNKFLHTKDRMEKRRGGLLLAAGGLLLLLLAGYVAAQIWGLCALGLGEVVEPYLITAASLLVFVFGLFQGGHRMFGGRGHDILCAMPLKASELVLGRFAALYVENLLLTLAMVLPGGIAQWIFDGPEPTLWAKLPFLPLLPMVVSVVFGTVVMAVSTRAKHRSLIQTGLMLLLVVGLLASGFLLEEVEFTPELLALLSSQLGRVYPLAFWRTLPFCGLSVLALVLSAVVISKFYHPIMGKLLSFSAKQKYRLGQLEHRSIRKALYLREARRYFSSSVYVTNTIIGPIMGLMLSVWLFLGGTEAIPMDIGPLMPYALGAVFTTMTTTASSISMEGRHIWAIQSLPIPRKDWLDAKILLNLSLMAPFYLLSEVFLFLVLRPTRLEGLWLAVLPAATMGFAAVFGITVNLRFHRFDWAKEGEIVKQSLSSMLGGFGGMVLSLALVGLSFLMPTDLLNAGATVLLAGLTAFLYRRNNCAPLDW